MVKTYKNCEFNLFQGTLIFTGLVFYGEKRLSYFLILNCSFLGKIPNKITEQNELILNNTDLSYYYFIPLSFQECEQGFISIEYND